MNSVQITVPYWGLQLAGGALLVVALAVIGIVATQYIKHRYTLRQGKKLALLAVHNLLVLVAAGLTAISYYLPLLQTHLIVLEHLPYVGAYAATVYAGMNYIYALGKSKWFQDMFNTAQKLDAKFNAPVLDAPVSLGAVEAPVDSLEAPQK